MSDVKHEVNAKTSILGRQYTMTVTFDGSFLCLNVILSGKFPQNVTKLLILTTKAMIKQCKYSWKPVKNEPH